MSGQACTIDGCGRFAVARGFCKPHYNTARREGLPLATRKPAAERFWENVSKDPDGCWRWTGALLTTGYGKFQHFRVNDGSRLIVGAHRIAWFLSGRPLPETKMMLCHHCDNRLCVNPAHIFVGTAKDNAEDCKRKGRNNFGARNGAAKMDEETVRNVRTVLAAGVSQRVIAQLVGVSESAISNIATGDRWKHVREVG